MRHHAPELLAWSRWFVQTFLKEPALPNVLVVPATEKKDETDQQFTSLVSVMPEKLLDSLTKEETADQFAFLETEPNYMTVHDSATPTRSVSEALADASGWCAAESRTMI